MLRKRFQHIASTVVSLIVMFSLLAACSTPAPATQKPATEPPAVPSGAKPKEIHILSFMTEPRRIEWQQKVSAAWAKEEPDVALNWENLGWEGLQQKHIAYETANDQVDIGSGWSGFTNDFYRLGIIEPVSDYIPDWNNRFQPFLTKGGSDVVDGKYLMALPISLELYGMFVRKDLVEQAGYKVSDLTSFDKMAEVAKAVAKINNGVAWGLPYGNARNAATQGTGMWMANGLWNLADFREDKKDAYIELLTFLQDVSTTLPQDAYTWDAGGFRRGFAQGTTAFIPIGQYFIPEGLYDMGPTLIDPNKIAYISWPSGSHSDGNPNQRVVTFGASGLYLMKNTSPERKAMTVKFLKWLVDDSGLLYDYDSYPAIVNADYSKWLAQGGGGGGYQQWFIDEVSTEIKDSYFAEQKPYPASSEVDDAYYQNILPLVRGEADPETTYEKLKAAIVPLVTAVEPDYYK